MKSIGGAEAHLQALSRKSVNVSSNYFGHALVFTSIFVFGLLCASSATDQLPFRISTGLSGLLVSIVLLFRRRFQVDWMKFKENSVLIRGSHGYIELERGEIRNIEIQRSLRDEESLFTQAYKLSFDLNCPPKRLQDLIVSGIEISSKPTGDVLVFRLSGIQITQAELRKLVVEWMRAGDLGK